MRQCKPSKTAVPKIKLTTALALVRGYTWFMVVTFSTPQPGQTFAKKHQNRHSGAIVDFYRRRNPESSVFLPKAKAMDSGFRPRTARAAPE
jgi:hypothetical protein